MSDILIKNIDPPKNVGLLLNISTWGQVLIGYATSRGISFLPVASSYCVEIPEHGDLVDRDYLLAMIDLLLSTAKNIGRENKGLEIFKKEIENAPVILPSNRSVHKENT